nr:Clp protease ClpP [uncultured Draconibacterium sp.]
MAKKIIVIDGYIGAYQFSKQFIRQELSGHKNSEVTVKVSSLGGAVDHALGIHDQFVEHGNIVVELSAFVASSATLLSLGAKTVKMNENSFYLIHKAMHWVDEWGTMNEDDIDAVIAKLEKQKQELAKITLQLAKMYTNKTGKTLNEIIDLMKEETWLTAEEAKEWGFVDEIIKTKEVENFLDTKMVNMITASGYPIPESKRKHLISNKMADKKDEKKLQFKSEDELKAYMKENFGFEPTAEVNKDDEPENEFKFDDEKGLIAWFKNTFGISPKAKKPEKKDPENTLDEPEETEEVKNLKKDVADKDTEIENLKNQVKELGGKPGAKTANVDTNTDNLGGGDNEDPVAEDFFEAYATCLDIIDPQK